MHSALLLAILVLCSVSARREVPEKIISVAGRLDDLTARRASAHHENLAGIVQHALLSRIHVNGDSSKLEALLRETGYDYKIEKNHEIEPQQNDAPWNLDYLDNRRTTFNGRYNPPSTGQGIHIYNLDLGINIDHPEFNEGRARRDPAWKNEAPCDNHHGTWTAVISSGRNYGVASQSIVWDVKLPSGSDCAFYVSDALDALQYLLTRPAPFIVSMSWKSSVSPAINELCAQLRQHGAILVAAAGNDGLNGGACSISPASSNSTISVASVGRDWVRSSWSNYGDCIDVFAPGEDIVGGNSFSDGLVESDGTSASCPHVAGAAAVLMRAYGLTSPADVEAKLQQLYLSGWVKSGGTAPNRLLSVAPLTSTPSPPAGDGGSASSLAFLPALLALSL
jgi:subtilisin family serine protease